MGIPTVRGKESLSAYWTTALSRLTSLRFTVDRVVWDSDSRELAIIYTSETNGKATNANAEVTTAVTRRSRARRFPSIRRDAA